MFPDQLELLKLIVDKLELNISKCYLQDNKYNYHSILQDNH